MKIVYVTMNFPAPSETFAAVDVRELIRQGHEVLVGCLRPTHTSHDLLVTEQELSQVKVNTARLQHLPVSIAACLMHPVAFLTLLLAVLTHVKNPRDLLKSLFFLPRAVELFRWIKKEKPDVVHLFWGHFPAMVGLLVGKFLPASVRLSMFLGAYDLGKRYGLSEPCSRHAATVFTHCYVNREDIRRLGIRAEKIHVVHRGIAAFSSEPLLPSLNRPIDILSAGRLIESKGFGRLLSSVHQLALQGSPLNLMVAGDGAQLKSLRRQAEEWGLGADGTFPGRMPQHQLFHHMAHAKLFVLFSTKPYERLPNAIKEALFFGCYILTLKTPGIEELITDKQLGLVLENTSDDSLLSGLKDALSYLNSGEFDPRRGRRHITENFNAEKQMQKLVQHWQTSEEKKWRTQKESNLRPQDS